jgi:hypothetical protein
VCVSVALVIRRATRMLHVTLSVASSAGPYLSRSLIKGAIFGRKFIEYIMCVLIFFKTFVRNISL